MWIGAWTLVAAVFLAWLYFMPLTLAKQAPPNETAAENEKISGAVESTKGFLGDMQKKWEELNEQWNETVKGMQKDQEFEAALKEKAEQELEVPMTEAEKQILIEALKNAASERMEKNDEP